MGCKVALGTLLFAALAAAQTDIVGAPDHTASNTAPFSDQNLYGPLDELWS